MNAQTELPTIRAGLGDTLLAVRGRSSFRFDFSRLTDDDLVGVDVPVRFEFTGPLPFELPPARFVALDCTAAVVVGIETSPHLDYLADSEALALADSLMAKIAAAGWTLQAAEPRVTGREELRLRLRDPALPDAAAWYVGAYSTGSSRLLLRLKRVHRKGRMAATDLFLLSLQWRDEPLAARADEASTALRQVDGVGPTRPRAIDLERYSPRVDLRPR